MVKKVARFAALYRIFSYVFDAAISEHRPHTAVIIW
jgi:hypothetical protein